MKLTSVIINGKIHRLSDLALEILGLEKAERQDKPIEIQKLPPNLEIIKIQKKEPEPPVEVRAIDPPVEVKKNEDAVTVVSASVKPKAKRSGSKVGVKK